MRSSLHTPEHRALCRLLRQARLDAGLTQVQVAKALRWTQSRVSDTEKCQRHIGFLEVVALARLYKKKLTFFIPP